MGITYDPAKSQRNLIQRGFDFSYAARIFEGTVVEWPSPTPNEQRFVAIGRVDDIILAVVYTWRGHDRRIISARPARRSERDVYRAQEP